MTDGSAIHFGAIGKKSLHKKTKPKVIVTHVASSKSKIENDKTTINNIMKKYYSIWHAGRIDLLQRSTSGHVVHGINQLCPGKSQVRPRYTHLRYTIYAYTAFAYRSYMI